MHTFLLSFLFWRKAISYFLLILEIVVEVAESYFCGVLWLLQVTTFSSRTWAIFHFDNLCLAWKNDYHANNLQMYELNLKYEGKYTSHSFPYIYSTSHSIGWCSKKDDYTPQWKMGPHFCKELATIAWFARCCNSCKSSNREVMARSWYSILWEVDWNSEIYM